MNRYKMIPGQNTALEEALVALTTASDSRGLALCMPRWFHRATDNPPKNGTRQLWVTDDFCVGANRALRICEAFGHDPFMIVRSSSRK